VRDLRGRAFVTDGAFPLPARILEEAAHLFTEIVPPEAQTHLLNAQRELLLAVALTIEHNSTRRVNKPGATRKRQTKSRATKRPSRVELD
jgi:hypothetical protein